MPSARVLSVARLRSSVTTNVNTHHKDSGAIMAYMTRGLVAVTAALALSVTGGVVAAPAQAEPRQTAKTATATGYGGAVSTVDPEASAAAIEVLRKGGNAADAAVAAAATLGVTEPYSAGIGGGGYFVYYDAKTGKVGTVDGRETAPATMPHDAFIDPATGQPYRFTPELVTSGVAVGVPGTPATWQRALQRWGSLSLGDALDPAIKVATRGFVVDGTFRQQTLDNKARFAAFPATSALFLPGGDAPAVGTIFQNHDLAATYRLLAKQGTDGFYRGPLAADIAATVQAPAKAADTTLPVPAGFMTTADLAAYGVRDQAPTRANYPGLVEVPTAALTDPLFGKERACLIDPLHAAAKPVAPVNVSAYDGVCPASTAPLAAEKDTENISTTNLTVADKWGNVAEYTLTIEQTGGSGMVVPGRGSLLNNEMTDFSTVYDPKDPNRIEPGKRPRSSMAPTIILKDGAPFLALGSPGGSTIITTVLQTILNRVDLGMTISEAIAAPRASQRNTAKVTAEPAFIDAYGGVLAPFGHRFTPSGDAFTSAAEIGAATAIEFGPGGRLTAAAEPVRRGGGSAMVLKQAR